MMTLSCMLYGSEDVINNIFANDDSDLHAFTSEPSETDLIRI